MKKLFLLGTCLYALCGYAQQEEVKAGQFKSLRTRAREKDTLKFTANDYKYITLSRDTLSVDTTLTVQALYQMNPARKDLFTYQSLANMGQAYNNLAYNEQRRSVLPNLGTTANKNYYLTPESIPYYYVPTPITRFAYNSAMEQGQMLHTVFSANLTPQTNIFVRYNGLRSLGEYQSTLTSVGNFVGGISFTSPNKKYWGIFHYSSQDVFREENGGISTPEQFESGEEQFLNRAGLDVFMTGAETKYTSKRYFLQHQYNLLRNAAKTNSAILIKHRLQYESQKYDFNASQTASDAYLGESYTPTNLSDKARLITFTNELGAELKLPYLGMSYLYGKSHYYNYYFNGILVDAQGNFIPNRITHTDWGLGLRWEKQYKGFAIEAQGEQFLLGTLLGTDIIGKLSYQFNKENQISAGLALHSAMPDFNFLLYQSDYKNYNWYHLEDFLRENRQELFADVQTKWADASVRLANINHFTYFESAPTSLLHQMLSEPKQYAGDLQYMQVKLRKEFRFWKLALDNTLLYQQVLQGNEHILNLPQFVTRNTLYFSSHVFKKAMYLQTGISLKYFTSYYADRYNPLLSAFEVQQSQKIGNYPVFDFFIDAKVRTMRIFLRAEHFNAGYTGFNYYAAPYQPYRDLTLRIGILWDFFS